MSKSDIINRVAEETGHTKLIVSAVVDESVSQIGKALIHEGEVKLHGFGSFTVKDTKARTARNPVTGAPVEVPAGKKVSFKLSSELKKVL